MRCTGQKLQETGVYVIGTCTYDVIETYGIIMMSYMYVMYDVMYI